MIKKYLLTIATVMLLAVGCGDGSDTGDTGTPVVDYTIDNGTWLINTAQGLREFAEKAKTTPNTNAKLMNDINLGGSASEWVAIGKDGSEYAGTFDGNNKTISGLYINQPNTDFQGLFGYVDTNGIVKNLRISNPQITGLSWVGGIAGYNRGTITSSYVNGGSVTGNELIGGIAGHNAEATITASYVSGVSITGVSNHVGGITGYSDQGVIENVAVVGGTINGKYVIGGIVGYNEKTPITAAYNTGTVTGKEFVGGIAGDNRDSTLTAIYNTGVVTGESNDVGGVIGINDNDSTVNTVFFTRGAENGIGELTSDINSKVTILNAALFNAKANYIFVAGENGAGPTIQVGDPSTNASHIVDNNGTWEIYTAKGLREFVSTAGLSANAKLMNDINLEGNADNTASHWTAIGKDDLNPYTGTFDGDNKTISGLYIETNTSHQGLFGYVNGGTIKNLKLSNPTITGNYSVGGVVGENHGTVENVKVIDGTVTGNSGTNNGSVGGIVGENYGTVTTSYNTSKVSGIGNVGGVVGWNTRGTVTASYNTGEVDSEIASAGGVVGHNKRGSITASYNTGVVSGSSYNIGGVVGYNQGGIVTAVHNTGALTGGSVVGGVVGSNDSDSTVNTAYFTTSNNDGINGIGNDTTADFGVTDIAELNTKVTELSDALALVGYNYIFVAGVNGASPTIQANEMCINPANNYVENTETTPSTWEIYTAEGLKAFNTYTANLSTSVKLMCNINLNGSDSNQWTAIGTHYETQYTGTFDGDNKTISGLYINQTEANYQGLFGYVDTNGIVKNLRISNPTITGKDDVGGVASINNGIVENVAVIGGTINGEYVIGGIVGTNNGTVTASYNTGAIGGTANSVGGIVGENSTPESKVIGVYNTGNVEGASYVGGIVGKNVGLVNAMYNTGVVTGDKDHTGSLVGNSSGNVSYGLYLFGITGHENSGIGSHGGGDELYGVGNMLYFGAYISIPKLNEQIRFSGVTDYRFDENDISKFVLLP